MATKKERCKDLMAKFFGPNSASLVDFMSEDECVEKCRKKVTAMLGADKARVFDNI
jgi:hypothetical protein